MQVHLWAELGRIALIGLGDVVSACRDLDLWPFDLISMPRTQVHTSPKFGQISSNIYEDIVLTLLSRSLPAVTLTFDLLTPEANQHIYEPKYIIVTKIGWNSLNRFLRYDVDKVFLSHCLLWPQPLT